MAELVRAKQFMSLSWAPTTLTLVGYSTSFEVVVGDRLIIYDKCWDLSSP